MKSATVLMGEISLKPHNSYYLLERDTEKGKIFGVMVSNKDEECCIPGLFEDRSEAVKFVRKIMENNVCPTHLINVTDDYFSEGRNF